MDMPIAILEDKRECQFWCCNTHCMMHPDMKWRNHNNFQIKPLFEEVTLIQSGDDRNITGFRCFSFRIDSGE